MKKTNLLAILTLAATPAFLHAQTTSYSEVVGYQKIPLPYGGKAVAPTFVKANVFSGSATITGSTVTVGSGALTGLSLGPTLFSPPVVNFPRYYAEVVSSNSLFYGYNFDISSANTGDSFTSPNIPVGLSGPVSIAIRAHVTLDDLDPANMSDGDSVTIYDSQGNSSTYYQASSSWVDSNGNPGFGHVPVYPGTGFVFAGQTQANTITVTGTVKNTPTAVPVYVNAYANIVAAINPSTIVNYANQNLAASIGDGAAFTRYTGDGSFIEDSTFYSASGDVYDSNGNKTTSALVSGGEAVNVGSLAADTYWIAPAAISR
jgi:hypothetical protein